MTDPQTTIPAFRKRDFRVYYESIYPGGTKFAYPAQEPFMTRDEADEACAKENAKGYVRAWVIGRDGIGA